MQPLLGVTFMQLDMTKESSISEISKHTGKDIDAIISDMSSNHSGITDIDCASLVDLNMHTLYLAKELLRPGGKVLMKMLHGDSEEDHYVMYI